MLGHWRGLCGTVFLLAALALTPAPAGATYNGVIDVWAYSVPGGGFRVYENSQERMFFGAFAISMVDGPQAGKIFEGGEYYLGEDYQSLSSASETTADGVVSQASSYAVTNGGEQLLRVDQLIRMREGERAARFTYDVTNVSGGPIAFRPSVTGVTRGDATLSTTTARRLTFLDEGSELGARLEEVRSSTKPGDLAPVSVPAWQSYRTGSYHDVFDALRAPGGLGAPRIEPWGGVAAEWADHASSPLPAGATARYEIVWRFDVRAPLYATVDRYSGYVGVPRTITVRLGDAAGLPDGGGTVRWSVSGDNPQAERGAVADSDGSAKLSYTGANTGYDTITVYRDLDGDRVRDANEPQRVLNASWSPLPPRLTLDPWGTKEQVGRALYVRATLRDEAGEPATGGVLRWTLSGRNAAPEPGRLVTSWYGEVSMSVIGRYAGSDTLTVWADDDDDGVRDAGEPARSVDIEW